MSTAADDTYVALSFGCGASITMEPLMPVGQPNSISVLFLDCEITMLGLKQTEILRRKLPTLRRKMLDVSAIIHYVRKPQKSGQQSLNCFYQSYVCIEKTGADIP